MSLLFETIRIRDGTALHLSYHEQRMNNSRAALMGLHNPVDLGQVVRIPDDLGPGDYKCRLTYAKDVESCAFEPYRRRVIRTLQLVNGDGIDYSYKYLDRSALDLLKAPCATDDILIVKNGLITDTSYSNVVCTDGVRWITPAVPLLAGTARARLIDEGRITMDDITPSMLQLFSSVLLVNAMMDLGEAPLIATSDIVIGSL